MDVKINIRGTAPLITHNVRLANPLDPIARQMKVISGKRKKTDEDYEALARLEFEGGLYLATDGTGPMIPGANVAKCLVEGARITKQGKQVERGVLVNEIEIPLLYEGPRDVESLWKRQEDFVSCMAVKVGTSRVMRTRPIFRDWALECTAVVDGSLLNLEQFSEIVDQASAMAGLCEMRPRYGRFHAVVEKV